MAQPQRHPIFEDIARGDLEAVKQRVLADAAVLEERKREHYEQRTPLMAAITLKNPAIALWVIQHRGQHNLEAAYDDKWTALHWASTFGPLQVVQALVAAGANPAALTGKGSTPLILASNKGQTDVVAFLLQLPAVEASINNINEKQRTALSRAASFGHQRIVQLFLDAGADPFIPPGYLSPLRQALYNKHHTIATFLSELERGQAERGKAPPRVELIAAQQQQQQQGNEGKDRLPATAAFAVGASDGEKNSGLCNELYVELLMYMLPPWANEGPAA